MRYTSSALLQLLDELGISFRHFNHPAVFTTADVALLPERLPGADTKNLFLRDEKRRRYVLVCVRAETRVDLKQLGKVLGMKGLTFASPEDLEQMLGVVPGSVCLFGLVNDTEGRVEGFIDSSIDRAGEMQNHPLVNTETVVLRVEDMLTFCSYVRHELTLIDIPERL
jgi:Ala-tRNA(Pro) deacylase